MAKNLRKPMLLFGDFMIIVNMVYSSVVRERPWVSGRASSLHAEGPGLVSNILVERIR